ncbi:MAG: hypothetical protein C4328_05805 [Meiothermus sp.]
MSLRRQRLCLEHEPPYPSDVRDEEWALVLPYLTLAPLEAPQPKYDLREVRGTLRWMVRTGAQWSFYGWLVGRL